MSLNIKSSRKLKEAKINSDNHILAVRDIAEEEAVMDMYRQALGM